MAEENKSAENIRDVPGNAGAENGAASENPETVKADERAEDLEDVGGSDPKKRKLRIALIVVLSVKSSYKPVRRRSDAAEYLVDGSLQMEFNFYEFGAPDYLPGSSHWSPYVAAGLGLTGYESDKVRVSGSLHLGIGLKYTLPCRLNIGLEVSHRFSFTDRLDYSSQGGDWQLDDPWIARSDWNKNKDGYTTVKIFITYDFFFIGSSCYKE